MTARARWRTQCLALAVLLAASLPACYLTHQTSGRDVPTSVGLVVGRTTKAEALALLGPPVSVRRQTDGEIFLYRQDELRGSRLLLVPLLPIYERSIGSQRSDLLMLLFDGAGLLAAVGEQRGLAEEP
ncbi:MAG: hypothetical protein ACT4PU_11860 [Planctomycetota bacterium]